MRRWIMAVTACLGISVAASAQPGLLGPLKFHAPIPGDKPPLVVGDRFEYWAGDPSGQFIAILPVPKEGLKGARLRVRLLPQEPAEAPPLAEAEQSDPETAKVAFLIRTATLRPGKYLVRAALLNAQGVRSNRRSSASRGRTRGTPRRLFRRRGFPCCWRSRAFWPMACGRRGRVFRFR